MRMSEQFSGSRWSGRGRLRVRPGLARWSLAYFCGVALTGCSLVPELAERRQPVHHVTNYQRAERRLPAELRRVALLPLTMSGQAAAEIGAGQSLEPVLQAEVRHTRTFELVSISPEQLQRWTGRSAWNSEDALPEKFFEQLREATACDAVLFCQLTQFRPYAPLAVGWKLALVDGRGAPIWWAADEVFDAGEPAVAAAARQYYRTHFAGTTLAPDAADILRTPGRFAQYAAHAVLETMPEQ